MGRFGLAGMVSGFRELRGFGSVTNTSVGVFAVNDHYAAAFAGATLQNIIFSLIRISCAAPVLRAAWSGSGAVD